MNANGHYVPGSSGASDRVAVHPIVVGLWAVAVLLLSGCTTNGKAGLARPGARLMDAPRLDLGTIAVVPASDPALFSFDRARGQIEDAGAEAADAAGRMMVPPDLHDELPKALLSPFSFALAPFAALHGAIAAQERLKRDGLSQCESNLARAMMEMAAQNRFRDSVVSVGAEKTRRHFISADLRVPSALADSPVDAVLKTEVQELRLERTGSGDESFALRVKARTILLRAADGAVLFDEPVEYRSGTCLFLDWTRGNSFRQVAATAYGKLAEQVVEHLVATTVEQPVLVGAGYRKAPARDAVADVAPAGSGSAPGIPPVHFVNSPADPADSIDVYSSAWLTRVDAQKPLTRDEAANEAVADLTWQLDGLYNHPNYVVSAIAFAAAIPIGVWKQGAAVVRGLSPAKIEAASAKLSATSRDEKGDWRRPHEELAAVVSQQLATQISQPVMLVKERLPTPEEFHRLHNHLVAPPRVSLVSQRAAHRPYGAGAESALDVHLIRVALTGHDGINPAVALCVDAEARWIRTRDGREIYSCPIQYRGEARHFTTWAANDAQLFREELQRAYREVGTAMVGRLVSRQIVTPKRALQPILATN